MTIYQRVTTKIGYRALLVVALIVAAMNIDYNSAVSEAQLNQPRQIVLKPLTPLEIKIVKLMEKEQSPVPTEIAKAVTKHKHPRVLSGIAAVESGGNPAAVGKLGEKGMYQVREHIWGKVPEDVKGQTDQAADILESLLAKSNGRIAPALSAWNGDSTGIYAAKVNRKVASIK